MDVRIRPELQQFVDNQVKSGRYDSTGDMINAALATLQMHEELSAQAIENLRAEIDIGIAEADRGNFVDFTAEDIIASCHAEFEKQRAGTAHVREHQHPTNP